MCFEFGEGHFYRVQVWAVGWQEQEPAACIAHGLGGVSILMRGEVVQDNDGSGFQFWGQYFFDVSREGGPSIAPLMTQGAIMASEDRPAMKVWVPRDPKGASMTSRSPRCDHPR